ncbi:MAG: methionine adenosyltransferase [Defluviitaleaceae bacterium]|nr:methionine adenosyltransferase [Defluviitaleaceae bacterium]
MNKNYYFSSESVTEGHPDKLCDMIADAVLDTYLEKDPDSRVACEVIATTGAVTLMGEITSNAVVDIPELVRNIIREVGYSGADFGFDADLCAVNCMIGRQSDDINQCVTASYESRTSGCADTLESQGAGDQGLMFGYACNDTDSKMPAPIYYAHQLSRQLCKVRKEGKLGYLGPDGKTMVTVEYKDGSPARIDAVVVSTQHKDAVSQAEVRGGILEHIVKPILPESMLDKDTQIMVNPSGRFVKGGPCADTGLSGRKIIVDTYGGFGRHGGGSFSGKDPTKVDRTGAYAARYIAKNIVAAGAASHCEVQIAYAIGVANPVSIHIDAFGTAAVPEETLMQMCRELFDLRPKAIIEQFGLTKVKYRNYAAYGHMGRGDLETPWEKLNHVEDIRRYLKGKS